MVGGKIKRMRVKIFKSDENGRNLKFRNVVGTSHARAVIRDLRSMNPRNLPLSV
jgi:hypothetical protein